MEPREQVIFGARPEMATVGVSNDRVKPTVTILGTNAFETTAD